MNYMRCEQEFLALQEATQEYRDYNAAMVPIADVPLSGEITGDPPLTIPSPEWTKLQGLRKVMEDAQKAYDECLAKLSQ